MIIKAFYSFVMHDLDGGRCQIVFSIVKFEKMRLFSQNDNFSLVDFLLVAILIKTYAIRTQTSYLRFVVH